MTERILNLVVPLAHEATAMRITETAGSSQERSGAVSQLIGSSLRQGDVDSTTGRSNLTSSLLRYYSHRVTCNQVIGIGVPETRRTSRQQCGFFHVRYHMANPYGRAVWGSASCAGTLSRYANLHGSAHPDWRQGRGKQKPQTRSIVMSNHIEGALDRVIDRDTASKLNPLISPLWTEDTLDSLSSMVNDLGYLLSIEANPPPGSEPHFGHLFMIFGPIAAALKYETENLRSVVQARKDKE